MMFSISLCAYLTFIHLLSSRIHSKLLPISLGCFVTLVLMVLGTGLHLINSLTVLQSVTYLFILLKIYLRVEVLIFMKFNFLYFSLGHAFGVIAKQPLTNSRMQRISSVFFQEFSSFRLYNQDCNSF